MSANQALDSYFVQLATAVDLREQSEAVALRAFDAVHAARGRRALVLLELLGARGSSGESTRAVTVPPKRAQWIDGRYEVRGRIGRGGFAEVWLAFDHRIPRLVALKTLRSDLPSEHVDFVRRSFGADAHGLAAITHRNVVRVHNSFEAGGRPYLDLEYIKGMSLAEVLEHGPMDCADALRYVAAVGDALAALHQTGLVHRDIKPDNVLLETGTDDVKLTDFGLAVRAGTPVGADGTPCYMAPEAFEGVSDKAVDIYSLAATLFALLSGKPPFSGDAEAIRRQCSRGLDPRDPRLQRVPEGVRDVLCAAMSPEPSKRPKLADLVSACEKWCLERLAKPRPDPTKDVLALRVQRWDGSGWAQIAGETAQVTATRDLVVPEYALSIGDRVCVEIDVAQAGYLALFNVGPSGKLNLLYPRGGGGWAAVSAGATPRISGIEVRPPAGRERIFGLWCKEPRKLQPDELQDVAGAEGRRAPGLTRDLVRMQGALLDLPASDWQAIVFELDSQQRP